MLNFSIISLISLVLIYQNIFLLNEETLILICFIIFSWVAFTKLSDSISTDLTQRSGKIENMLSNSLGEVMLALSANAENQTKFKNLPKNFENLGNHFFQLSSAVSNQLPIYLSNKSESIYSKKFVFVQRLEKQTIKLLALLVAQKLNKLVVVQKFCTNNLKVPSFLCFKSIHFLNILKNV